MQLEIDHISEASGMRVPKPTLVDILAHLKVLLVETNLFRDLPKKKKKKVDGCVDTRLQFLDSSHKIIILDWPEVFGMPLLVLMREEILA